MSLTTKSSSETLKEIERGFETYRSAGSNRSVQLRRSLQGLAVKALAENFTAKEVARAADVTPRSVRNWRNSRTKVTRIRPRAKRLRVLREVSEVHLAAEPSLNFLNQGARITLTSGVIIECRADELSKNLLLDLSSLSGSK